jgi:hypothetical protein
VTTTVARLALLAATGPALLALGCGGSSAPSPPPHAKGPPLCTRLHARVTGHVDTAAATELSGLVLSRSHRGVLWTLNDSGDSARLVALSTGGRPLGELHVEGAENFDWEDVAATPGSVYAGDIGDNLAQRPSISVYRVPDRSLSGTAMAKRFTLRYPDGPHDAEALLVDPSNGAFVIVTKSLSARAGVYVAAHPSTGAVTTMRRAGSIPIGDALPVTAGDVSADGRTVVIRTYDRAFVWSRRPGESLVATLRRRACTARADLLVEGQGESLALTRDGRAFYTVPEGRRPALRRWAP